MRKLTVAVAVALAATSLALSLQLNTSQVASAQESNPQSGAPPLARP